MRGIKVIWLVLAIAVVGISAVAGIGLVVKTSPVTSAGQNTIKTANEPPTAPAEAAPSGPILAITGTIESIDNGLIKIRAQVKQGPTERNIVVSDQTAVAALVPLTAKESAAAIKKYQAELKAGKDVTMPPPFREVAITPNDLRVTMAVTVAASEDIKDASTITAERITFYAPPSTPPGK